MFHSADRHDLTNQNDMRFQLLDYCYGVIARGQSPTVQGSSELVPEDIRDSRFDSLFEQGYRIDLVVVGGLGRLALECDGDHWHGREAFERDMARQRELARCGWRFFRIRESAFYADPTAVLRDLWDTQPECDIHRLASSEVRMRYRRRTRRVSLSSHPNPSGRPRST